MSPLRSRLSNLRRQAGNSGDGPTESAQEDLRQTLERATRIRDQASARLTDHELADYLGGRCTAPCVIAIEGSLAIGSPHGQWNIGADLAATLAFFGHHDEVESLVFMDTETTGLAGGTGTSVFLLGLARFQGDALLIRQYFMSAFKGEAPLLEQATRFIDGARTLVSYNGKTFDHPLLQTRYRLMGLDDPFAGLAHFDLLHPTRRAFASRWPDCRLRTAETRLLGFQRLDDLPGSEAPETWFQWMRQRSSQVFEVDDL